MSIQSQPAPSPEIVATPAGMNQAKHIYGAAGMIVLAIALLTYYLIEPPEGMDGNDKCSYPSYERYHGGSYNACIRVEADAAAHRLLGY